MQFKELKKYIHRQRNCYDLNVKVSNFHTNDIEYKRRCIAEKLP